MLLGRFFCGWACHVVAYQDLAALLLRRLGLRPRPVRSRLLLVVPFYAAFSMFAWPSIERHWIAGEELPALAWHLTTGAFWERFPGVGMTLATVVVCGGLIIWVLGAKGFCTYACPYGALFGLVGRHAPGKIRVSDACEGCGHCTAVCTSEVRVHAEVARFGQVVDAGCMRCMDCVSACPKDALSFGFGLDPGAKAKGRLGFLARLARPPKENSRWDFGWGEELLLVSICALSVWSLRGAYGLVPFLLALALAVLVAFGSVTLLRLVTEKSLLVQHIQLRLNGRFTGAGLASLLLLPLALVLVAHTGLVQFHAKEGERLLVELSGGRSIELESIADHLGSASDLALIDTFKLENQLGQVLVGLGRPEEAKVHLVRAVELEPESVSARVELAWIYARAGDPDRAAEALAPIALFAPGDPNLVRSVRQMLERYPNNAGLLSLR
ncbi:MAG: polyferredoxin [Gammaproteobacteria bacterium]